MRPRIAAPTFRAPRSNCSPPLETALPVARLAPRRHFAAPNRNPIGSPNRRWPRALDCPPPSRGFFPELPPAETAGQSLPLSITTALSSLSSPRTVPRASSNLLRPHVPLRDRQVSPLAAARLRSRNSSLVESYLFSQVLTLLKRCGKDRRSTPPPMWRRPIPRASPIAKTSPYLLCGARILRLGALAAVCAEDGYFHAAVLFAIASRFFVIHRLVFAETHDLDAVDRHVLLRHQIVLH